MMRIQEYLATYTDTRPYSSELIDYSFNGQPAPEKQHSSTLNKNGTIITNFYIHIDKKNNINTIPNFYKIYEKLEMTNSGSRIFEIPLDYIALYYKIIKGINLELLSNKTSSVIPVLLKELVNIPFILFSDWQEWRLTVKPNIISIFDSDLARQVELNANWPDYDLYKKSQSKDIWKLIMSHMDDSSWAKFRQTCKFFYSLLSEQDIKNRYQKHKLTLNDVMFDDCNLEIMYHKLSKKTEENLQLQKFINEYRSIDQIKLNIVNAPECNIDITVWPIEWIIIEIDNFQKNIVDNIEFEKDDSSNIKILTQPVCNSPYNPHIATSTEIYHIPNNPEFYNKMHNPLENRYMYIPDPFCNKIKLTFKKQITAKMNIYVSQKGWLCSSGHPDGGIHTL